jgi:hypothetical protein
MAMNLQFNYAIIDLASGMCIGVQTTAKELTDEELAASPAWIPIDVCDPEYVAKYYINGNWYEDAEGTIPWASSLL